MISLCSKVSERDRLLYKYLVEKNCARKEALDASLAEVEVTGDRLGLVLVRNGFVDRKTIIDALLGMGDDSISEESSYPANVPPEVWSECKAMCLAITPQKVYLSTISSQAVLFERLRPYFPAHEFVFAEANPVRINRYIDSLDRQHRSELSHVEKIINDAIERRASDIHILPRRTTFSIFYRELGVLRSVYTGPIEEYQNLNGRIKDLASIDIMDKRMPGDGSFSTEYAGRFVDLRVSTLPMPDGEKIVIRVLDPEKTKDNLADLGISRIEEWRKGVNRSNGLCLIVGPTGSGKTTTLNATVREFNCFEKAIMSAEDPIEYNIPFIAQVNVNRNIGLDYASIARAFLRQDPDIILLGEIRDIETAETAIKAADTGHLVLATLHTGSVASTIKRLTDLGVKSHEIKGILRCVMAQKLVRKVCHQCEKQDPYCPKCRGVGYTDVTVVSENNYFQDEAEVQRVIDGEKPTWPLIIDDAYKKMLDGITDIEELRRVFPVEIDDYLKNIERTGLVEPTQQRKM